MELQLPPELQKRVERRAAMLGLTPEMAATFLLAISLREEEPPEPRLIFAGGVGEALRQGMIQPRIIPEGPKKNENKLTEEEYIAKQQRTEAMQIASILIGVGSNSGKSLEEVWGEYQAYYTKVHDRMVQENTADKIIGDSDQE